MDRHELNRMFDGLAPDPRRERELLKKLLQDDARRSKPMKNWKRVVISVAAAALLVTGAAAAVALPWIDQKMLDHLDVNPENSQAVAEAVSLLYPGAMALDIIKEDNGAVLHVTQILRDRTSVMVLAEFTAPEGTVLNMGEQDAPGNWMRKGFSLTSRNTACFVDEAGVPIGDGLVSYYSWEVLEDSDPLDNHITVMLNLHPQAGEEQVAWNAAALQIPAENLSYFDKAGFDSEAVYSGDWTVQVPLPQQDIGYVQQVGQVIGELDGANITLGEVYVSPMTLELMVTREGGVDLTSWTEENEAAQMRWLALANSTNDTTLMARDGETIALELGASNGMGVGKLLVSLRLSEVTDPAKFQGGTLTLDWACGKTVISLDGLTPVTPALSAD